MDDGAKWIDVLVAWAPMLVILAVWIYFMRKGFGPLSYAKYLEQHMVETRRHNERLEALIERMDTRLSQLEDANAKGTSDRP